MDAFQSVLFLVAGFVLLAFGANAVASLGLQAVGRRGAGLGLAFSLALVTVGSVLPEASLILQTQRLEQLIDDGRIYVRLERGQLPQRVGFSERSTEPVDRALTPPLGKTPINVRELQDVQRTLHERVTSNIPVGLLIGSSLINLLLVIGIAGLRVGRPIPTSRRALIRDSIFLVLGVLFAGFVIARPELVTSEAGALSRATAFLGIALAATYVLLCVSTNGSAETRAQPSGSASEGAQSTAPLPPAAPAIPLYLYFLGGLAALWQGSQLIINFIADHIMWLDLDLEGGTADVFVLLALFGLAFGVAIPELVAAAFLAKRDEPDLALGAVLTATVLNLLGGLGIAILVFGGFPGSEAAATAVGNPLSQFALDWMVLVVAVIFVISFCLSGKELSTSESIVLILLFTGYVVLRFVGVGTGDCGDLAECAAHWLEAIVGGGGGA
jgi:Ca2+/Na+ antiporter